MPEPTNPQPTDVVARVRAMHKPRTERHGSCCVQCGIVWPCPTSRVLDEAAPETDDTTPEA
jgi:hypothetical protein